MGEGSTRDHDPRKIGTAARSGRALVRFRERGVGDEGGPRGQRDREGERRDGRPRARGFGHRALGAGRLGCWWAAPGPLVGCARRWLGRLAWLVPGAFLFFELERRENIEKYILFLYRTYIYQNSQGN